MSVSIKRRAATPYDLRGALDELDLSQAALVRRTQELGDDRGFTTILHSVQAMVSGEVRVSGEMRALIGLMRKVQYT